MNYRRGLFRVWIGLTLFWWAWCFYETQLGCHMFNAGPWCDYRPGWSMVITALLVPALVLLLGWFLLWVIKGFRSN